MRIVPRPTRDILGEGPLWSAREGALFWVDIIGKALHRLDLADDAVTSWDMPEMTGWVIEREHAPGFVAGLQSGFYMLTLEPFHLELLAPLEADLPGNRMNDAKADAAGRIWAGTMPVGCDRPSGALYRLDADRGVHRIDGGYTIANGPAFSADGQWLYHTDSALGLIYRYRLGEDGAATARAVHIAFEADWGKPDGMTVDAQGGLWVAHWGPGLVSRFDPSGKRERSIQLPASQITSCCFAGPGLDRLFVTSASDGLPGEPEAGALFEVDAGVRGLAPSRYAG